MKHISYTTGNSSSLLQKVLAVIVTLVLVVLGLMFSVVVFSVILVAGATFWAFLWWKMRPIRKQMQQMREAMRDFEPRSTNGESGAFKDEAFKGEIIEGEVISRGEPGEEKKR
ncbi:MAG: hypothetical protein OEV35_01805 [Gallionellaceae bacterium]|nr:hypothetical protein [Gallionellaceae bacterium]